MRLTIAIPTYNRNEMLLQNLKLLLPQLTSECELLIIDNCSDVPVEATISGLFQEWPDIKKQIVRLPANIGGANIIRCFELCKTKWLWVLSDAYPPCPDAVNHIQQTLSLYPDAIFVNFRANNHSRSRCVKTVGLQNFVDNIDNFGYVLMVSVGVFNAEKLLPKVAYAYHFSQMLAPHIVLVLVALRNGGECYFSTETLVRNKLDCGANTWSILTYPGILSLGELPLPDKVIQVLLSHIRTEILSHLVNYTRQGVQHALSSEASNRLYYMHSLFRFRYNYGSQRVISRAILFGIGILMRFPRFAAIVFRLIKGKDIMANPIPNVF